MKTIILSMIGIMALSGCIALDPAEEVIAEMAARRVAFYVGQAHPDLIEPGVAVCDEILQAEDVITAKPLLMKAVEVAINSLEIDDPFIAQDIVSIMKLLGIDREGNLSTDILGNEALDLGDLKTVAAAIKSGLLAAR